MSKQFKEIYQCVQEPWSRVRGFLYALRTCYSKYAHAFVGQFSATRPLLVFKNPGQGHSRLE